MIQKVSKVFWFFMLMAIVGGIQGQLFTVIVLIVKAVSWQLVIHNVIVLKIGPENYFQANTQRDTTTIVRHHMLQYSLNITNLGFVCESNSAFLFIFCVLVYHNIKGAS